MVGAQLNAQKLINFLGMSTTTTMLVRLKGDPELAGTLHSFLNDELAVNLETLEEAPLEYIPPQEMMHDKAPENSPKTDTVVIETDPKSF